MYAFRNARTKRLTMWQYLESQFTLAHLPVAPVHGGLRALVALGPEHVHGFRQLGVQRRLVSVV
jgi:hypothetical protein